MSASSLSGLAQRIGPIAPKALHPSLTLPGAGENRKAGWAVTGSGAESARNPNAGAREPRPNRAGPPSADAAAWPSADAGSNNNKGKKTRRTMTHPPKQFYCSCTQRNNASMAGCPWWALASLISMTTAWRPPPREST